MPTFVTLVNFTEQGIRNVRDTPERAEAYKDAARKMGVTVKDVYWTLGQYDVVIVADAPDAATITALNLSVASLGNVRTQTLPAFSAVEIGGILDKIKQ